ncbi:MAG TPA: hypothetical protein VFB07_12070 [Vicinamibacterales bacterium]|nr:hypothetical protein [Vicinamibacterales bacterium]
MPIIGNVNWKELETRGFIHVRGYLTPHDLEACREDYTVQPVDAKNQNNAVSIASGRATATLERSFQELMALVREKTDIRIDTLLGGYYFATSRGVFPWHQDHESFLTIQNHYDYVNLFIPVVKPRKDKSNLCVVPFDALERVSPRVYRHTVRGGASMAYDVGDKQVIVQSQSGAARVIDVPLDRIAETPQLEAGDLLLMRGDIFHRTEDGDTARVALSVRLGNSQTIVRRKVLADGGLAKMRTMAGNLQMYEPLFRAFDRARRDELSWAELEALVKSAPLDPPEPIERPARFLVRQKLRSGVLFSSARKVVGEVVRNQALWRYHQRKARKATATAPHPAAGRA